MLIKNQPKVDQLMLTYSRITECSWFSYFGRLLVHQFITYSLSNFIPFIFFNPPLNVHIEGFISQNLLTNITIKFDMSSRIYLAPSFNVI